MSVMPYPTLVSLLFAVLLSFALPAQNAAKIQAYLKRMDSARAFEQASWGFHMVNSKTQKPIAQFQSKKSLVPASVLKIFTTATGLALLGDTFRFQTPLLMEGKIDNAGVLNGNLIVKGKGNPVLGSSKGSDEDGKAIIELFAKQLKSRGIKRVKGSLRADVSYFEYEPVPSTWIWFDIGNYYASEISALNLGENQYELLFKPGKKVGDSTTFLNTTPKVPGLSIVNHTTTAIGGGDQTYIPGPPREMEKHIYGKMPVGEQFKVKGAIPQPENYFLQLLLAELNKQGISVDEGISATERTKSTNNQVSTLYTHYSAPLAEIARYANQTSNNLSAECILRTLGAEKGKEGSTNEGLDVVKRYLATRIPNAPSLKMTDGSGLSKYNLCSPQQMTTFLASIQKEPWFTCFVGSLPVSGKEGTLERICDGTAAEGKVIAKSGSMERIKCYAGYLKQKDGQLNAFSIFVNNHDVSNREIVKWIEGLLEVSVQ